MRYIPIVLLSLLMWAFIILGFYGLFQHFTKATSQPRQSIQWVR